ncbi:Uncharacterised protein [Amycolatopsis camponoti]|uniref:Uncharacterized protein n=1 Tax=Amycolatopsis camponoti TaxID=2606593 RepID=A0A6I8LFC5_9PSEU|nr:Uncharacterised protein [Amycolatopsis camponoti]
MPSMSRKCSAWNVHCGRTEWRSSRSGNAGSSSRALDVGQGRRLTTGSGS